MYVIYKPTPRLFDKSSAVEAIRNRFLHNIRSGVASDTRLDNMYANQLCFDVDVTARISTSMVRTLRPRRRATILTSLV